MVWGAWAWTPCLCAAPALHLPGWDRIAAASVAALRRGMQNGSFCSGQLPKLRARAPTNIYTAISSVIAQEPQTRALLSRRPKSSYPLPPNPIPPRPPRRSRAWRRRRGAVAPPRSPAPRRLGAPSTSSRKRCSRPRRSPSRSVASHARVRGPPDAVGDKFHRPSSLVSNPHLAPLCSLGLIIIPLLAEVRGRSWKGSSGSGSRGRGVVGHRSVRLPTVLVSVVWSS